MLPLERTIQKLSFFFEQNNIRSLASRTSLISANIDFELPIASFIGPGKIGKNFSFIVSLWQEKKGSVTYKIFNKVNSNVPYHPHFVIKYGRLFHRDPYAVWIGYNNTDKDIEQHLKTMILSLQYTPRFIITRDISSIGNRKALNWYLHEFHSNSSIFPTGNFLGGNFHVRNTSLPETKKKFEIKPERTPIKKKFEIRQEKIFEPKVKKQPEYTPDTSLNSLAVDTLLSPSKLFISDQAKKQIFNHICWGRHGIRETMNEQGGLLLGQVFYDPESNGYYGMVEQGIPAESAEGTPVYLQMNHDTWNEMMGKIDKLEEEQKEKDFRVIGWYHTHPNDLNVFMSGTDLNTQQKYFNQDWHFAIVLNPHKQIWKAFSGKNALECKGYFLNNSPENISENELGVKNIAVPQKQPLPIPQKRKRSFLKLFVVTGTIVLFIFGLLFLFNRNNNNRKTEVDRNTSDSTNKQKDKGKSVTKEITLDSGTIIYNKDLKPIFKNALANSLEVSAAALNDSVTSIETFLFVHRTVTSITTDSTLKVFEKLRIADSAYKNTLAGNVSDTLYISKGNYILKGDWYKLKLSGFIKQ